MKTFEIKGQKRTVTGKSNAKNFRKQGLVPCEVYGGKENLHLLLSNHELQKLVYTPNSYIVEIDVEGKKVKGIMHDIQFHPVSDSILHIDFIEVLDDKKVVIKIPVKIEGNSKGVRNGGKLKVLKRALKVSALPGKLPDVVDIDITNVDIGQSIKVKDLSYPGLELMDPKSALVVSVISSRVAKLQEEAPTPEAEAAAAEQASEESAS